MKPVWVTTSMKRTCYCLAHSKHRETTQSYSHQKKRKKKRFIWPKIIKIETNVEYVSRMRISSVCGVWMSERVWFVLAERDRATKRATLYAFWRPSPDRQVPRPLPAPPSSISQKLKQKAKWETCWRSGSGRYNPTLKTGVLTRDPKTPQLTNNQINIHRSIAKPFWYYDVDHQPSNLST